MPIADTDISTYLTGGAANADPNLSLGGAKSSVEWTGGTLHDLFDKITGDENAASEDEYRCIVVQNDHATLTAELVGVYIDSQTAGGATLALAVADEAKNVAPESVADEDTAPVGPVFSAPTTPATALQLGDLGPGEWRAIWLQRTTADTGALDDDGATIGIRFDTPE